MSIVHTPNAGTSPARIVRELEELIAALDRRVPQVERVGEVAIAAAAAALRTEAVKRIGALERAGAADAARVKVGKYRWPLPS
jgi:hypothetical protein